MNVRLSQTAAVVIWFGWAMFLFTETARTVIPEPDWPKDAWGDTAGFLYSLFLLFGVPALSTKVLRIGRIEDASDKVDYPHNWGELSRQARARDDYECGNCHATTDLHVHHIVPLSKGGTNNLSNLRTLCEDCHKRLHPHMR